MAEMLTYEQTLTSHTGGRGALPHGVLALRRGPGPPARQDHRGVQGRARRRQGRGGMSGRFGHRPSSQPPTRWVGHWPARRRAPRERAARPRPRTRPLSRRSRTSSPACGPKRATMGSAGDARRGAGQPHARAGRRRARPRAARSRPEPRRLRVAAAVGAHDSHGARDGGHASRRCCGRSRQATASRHR